MQITLKDRVAIVTGATGHIGRAICHVLAEYGACIAVLDIGASACENLCAELEKQHGTKCMPFPCDLADDASVHTIPKKVKDIMGDLHVLVNNAGFVGTSNLPGWITDIEHQCTETWRKVFEVNVTAPFTLCREAIPFLADKQGSIINISSIYGMLGPDMSLYEGTTMGNPIAYAASKAALMQMTKWLATVLAPRGIRANSICPGGIERNQPEVFQERYCARTPMKRMGTENDMTGAVLFLASDMSLYMTGQNLAVDGGWSAW